MEVPTEVMIHNETAGMKGHRGTLLQVSPHGYYEVNVKYGERLHRVLLPIARTVLIAQAAEETVPSEPLEIER